MTVKWAEACTIRILVKLEMVLMYWRASASVNVRMLHRCGLMAGEPIPPAASEATPGICVGVQLVEEVGTLTVGITRVPVV